jgi:hypothetical protein
LAPDLGKGNEGCIVIRQQRDHLRVLKLFGLLPDPEGFAQVSVQVLGTIMRSKGFLECARRECRKCGGVGFDAGANEEPECVLPVFGDGGEGVRT